MAEGTKLDPVIDYINLAALDVSVDTPLRIVGDNFDDSKDSAGNYQIVVRLLKVDNNQVNYPQIVEVGDTAEGQKRIETLIPAGSFQTVNQPPVRPRVFGSLTVTVTNYGGGYDEKTFPMIFEA